MVKPKKIVLVNMTDDKCVRDWRAPEYFKTATGGTNYIPLGLLSLATNLGQGHDVTIVDARSRRLTIDETIEAIEEQHPDILGISANTMRVFALNELLRRTSAPYKVVGGPHVNRYADLTLRQGADAVFVGQLADNEFKEAVETMPQGVVECKTRYNQIEFPNRSLVNYEDYYPKDFVFFKTQNRLHMLSSIGCPQRCKFCNNIPTNKIQRKAASKVLDEMQHLYDLGSRSIHFIDDNFNVSEPYLHAIIDEMDKRGLEVEWSGRGQITMTDGLAKRLAQHGFKRIHTGIEALDDNILNWFGKNSSVDRINRFCDTMNRNGIDVLGFFIVGTPLETDDYLAQLPDKIKSLGIKHPYIQILSPTPDSTYYKDLLASGVYKKDFWAEYIANPTPDFQIPYPYSGDRLKQLGEYVDRIEREYLVAPKEDCERQE